MYVGDCTRSQKGTRTKNEIKWKPRNVMKSKKYTEHRGLKCQVFNQISESHPFNLLEIHNNNTKVKYNVYNFDSILFNTQNCLNIHFSFFIFICFDYFFHLFQCWLSFLLDGASISMKLNWNACIKHLCCFHFNIFRRFFAFLHWPSIHERPISIFIFGPLMIEDLWK